MMANEATYGYNWKSFDGSKDALRWNRRDIPHLDRFVALCPQQRVAVQAGGNLGVYPKRLSESFDVVMTFEPSPELFPKMCKNAPEPNIIRFQAALGERVGFVGMACYRRDTTGKPVHEGLTHVAGDGYVPMLPLDVFALPVCDLIQIDIEGFELYALRGAQATILRCKPVIVVEVNGNLEQYGFQRSEVRSWLETHCYRFVERLKSDEVFVPC